MHESAEADLDDIRAYCPADGADLFAFIEHMQNSADLLDRLSSWHFRHSHTDPQFDCKAITSLQNVGYNVYRLVALPLEWARRFYRIIYAFDSEYNDFYVLAIVHRLTDKTPVQLQAIAYDYQPGHHITRRIREDYESLELPVRH